MQKPPLRIALGSVIGLILLAIAAYLGYRIAGWGSALFGPEAMLIGASVVATVAIVGLLGQYLSSTADYFLSIDNPRPLDENLDTIMILGWGFANQSSRSGTADLAGQGFADMRLFASRKQALASLLSFGFARPVSVAWRGNAGQHPLGDA
jgi:hypothetical protein